MQFPKDKESLLNLGIARMMQFSKANDPGYAGPTPPEVSFVDPEDWPFSVCAYYRPAEGIKICLPKCASPASVNRSMNWSWPGSDTDRTPYGVIAHELGHHVDYHSHENKGRYFSLFSTLIRQKSMEKPLTGYCDGDHEWFAEMFRLFITNPHLLSQLRPKTYLELRNSGFPLCDERNWIESLGENVPQRIVENLSKKIAGVAKKIKKT